MNNTVGVLLSVYRNDNPEWLRMSINSLLNQTYKDVCVYLGVDGPVGQNLKECIESYSGNKQVRIFRFENNRGLASVLNDLIEQCKTEGIEFLARHDADDIAPANRFDLQVSYLKKHSDVDVISGAVAEMRADGSLTGKIVPFPLTHEECKKRFRYRDPLTHPGVMFRRSFFEKVKGYRIEYRRNQDTMLWLDGFLLGCKFANIEEVVVNFRVNEDLYKNRRGGWKQARRMLKNRMLINRKLDYDITAYIFAFAMFFITILPSGIRKIIYDNRP